MEVRAQLHGVSQFCPSEPGSVAQTQAFSLGGGGARALSPLLSYHFNGTRQALLTNSQDTDLPI